MPWRPFLAASSSRLISGPLKKSSPALVRQISFSSRVMKFGVPFLRPPVSANPWLWPFYFILHWIEAEHWIEAVTHSTSGAGRHVAVVVAEADVNGRP